MRTPVVLASVASLALGTTLVTGPAAPASAGQGLTQHLASSVALDKHVTVPSVLHFCAFGTCAPEKEVPLSVVQSLAVTLDYDLKRSSSLPDVISKAGTLRFPVGDPDRACDGREGVHVEVSGTSAGATRVAARAAGEGQDHTVERPQDAPTPPYGRIVLCLKPVTLPL